MKKLTVLIFPALVLGMLAVGAANAQTRILLQGDIPFDFTVVAKALPAGSYDVLNTTVNTLGLIIRGTENLESAYFSTIAREESNPVDPKLVFRRYGNQYFLAELWTGEATGHELPKSGKELQVARNYREPQLIFIAAK